MRLHEARSLIERAEARLSREFIVNVGEFDRDGRHLEVYLTQRFFHQCRRGRVWKSKAFLTAFKNLAYGFDERLARSAGGRDGIFLLDRSYLPRNEMMRKIFDRYLDKPGSGAEEVARLLSTTTDALYAVRVVSHHMRLLGVMHRSAQTDAVVLVDYDDTP
jgi:hypothetical protein